VQVCARPDAGGQVGEDGCGDAALDGAEGVCRTEPRGVRFRLGGVVGGGAGRPAEERVGVQVAEEGARYQGADLGGGWVGGGVAFFVEDGVGAGGERG
jgi:hypothetical protein